MNGAFEPSFPIATSSLLASIGNKPHFGDTRVEKAPFLKGFGRGGGDRMYENDVVSRSYEE